MALDNLEAIVLKRCLAFEPRAVRTKIGFPFCPLASVYTSMPDVFQARRNLQSHFSKSRLDCAPCIGLCPLDCQPSRYWCCSVSSAEICAISAKDRKLVGYDDLHLPPPNAAPCKVHSPHIWAEDWPGSGTLSQIDGTPILWDSSSGYRLRLESPHSSSHTFSFFSALACDAC